MRDLKAIFRVAGIMVMMSLVLTFLLFEFDNCLQASTHHSIRYDWANFQTDDKNATMLEVYLNFANKDIQFIKKDSIYVANAELTAVLYDMKGNFVQEIMTEQTISELYYNLTSSEEEKNNVIFNFTIEPAKYRLELYLTDKNSNIRKEFKEEVVVKSFNTTQLAVSDIQIASFIETSEEKSNFIKNGRKIISKPSRTFDANNLFAQFYFEIYNLSMNSNNQQNSFTFHYYVKDKNDEIISEFTNNFAKPAASSAINFSIPTSNLNPGEYALSVEIIDNDSQAKTSKRTLFAIDYSPGEPPLADADEALEMLKVIASRQEMKTLKKNGQQNRREALINFWKSKDPTPGTTENEFMVEFYSRVDYANQAFTTTGREGWKTDRGKTLLRYGKPDRISSTASKQGWEQLEIWEYFRQDLKFVFIDRQGFGDYQLVRNSYFKM